MSASFELNAEVRDSAGKGAARRSRHDGKVPAILYGGDQEPTKLELDHNAVLVNAQNEAFYSHILTLNISGKPQRVVLKDMQRHAFKPRITHLDLQRVTDSTRIRMNVPLHFINADIAPGVKVAGGIVTHSMTSVEVMCQAKDLPEYIEVDLATLDAGHALHLSDLKLPAGVKIPVLAQGKSRDLPVAAIIIPRAMEEEAPVAAAAPAEGAAAAAPAAAAAGGDKAKAAAPAAKK